MKWLIRIILIIIGSFAFAAGGGYFVSSEVNVARSIDVQADPEDIFPYIANLDSHQVWSPWHDGSGHTGFQVSQNDEGVGQQSAWICESQDCLPGTEEIMVVQYPEYVQTDLNLDGQIASVVYALMDESSDGSTTILIEVKKDLGDFPYIQRLFKNSEIIAIQSRLDRALSDLADIVQQEGLSE